MKLKFIGTGAMVPSPDRGPSCFLVESQSGAKGLLDVGHTSIKKLVDQGVDLNSIDFVSISHFHTDHSADLVPLVHSRFVKSLIAKEDYKEITIIGPKETESVLNKLFSVFWREKTVGDELYPITVISDKKFDLFGMSFEAFPVIHKELYECQGIKISENGITIAFTADVGGDHPMQDLVENLKGVDVLLVEAGYPHKTPNHFSIDKIIELKEKANIKKVYLVHIRDGWMDQYKELLGDRADIFFARDGLEVDI